MRTFTHCNEVARVYIYRRAFASLSATTTLMTATLTCCVPVRACKPSFDPDAIVLELRLSMDSDRFNELSMCALVVVMQFVQCRFV